MYKLKNVTDTQEPFLVSCCNEGVLLDKVEYVSTDDGKEYLDFYYKSGNRALRDRRFPVGKENLSMMRRDKESPSETFERLIDEASKVFRHIALKFCTNEEVDNLEGTDFASFCKSYSALVNSKCKGVELYLKTTINPKGYVAVPKAGRFLQNMSEGVCTLSYTEKEKKAIAANSKKEGIAESVVEDDMSI
jgi:hypothetical protein